MIIKRSAKVSFTMLLLFFSFYCSLVKDMSIAELSEKIAKKIDEYAYYLSFLFDEAVFPEIEIDNLNVNIRFSPEEKFTFIYPPSFKLRIRKIIFRVSSLRIEVFKNVYGKHLTFRFYVKRKKGRESELRDFLHLLNGYATENFHLLSILHNSLFFFKVFKLLFLFFSEERKHLENMSIEKIELPLSYYFGKEEREKFERFAKDYYEFFQLLWEMEEKIRSERE